MGLFSYLFGGVSEKDAKRIEESIRLDREMMAAIRKYEKSEREKKLALIANIKTGISKEDEEYLIKTANCESIMMMLMEIRAGGKDER
ncbi:MAG: hypothetical protein GX465_19540 [Acidobacteria bacterium]|nr:hypothetical protein [Acidobacteriota bacterium]